MALERNHFHSLKIRRCLAPWGFNSPSRHHHQSRVGRGPNAYQRLRNPEQELARDWACDVLVTGRGRNQEHVAGGDSMTDWRELLVFPNSRPVWRRPVEVSMFFTRRAGLCTSQKFPQNRAA